MNLAERNNPPIIPPFEPGMGYWHFWDKEYTHPIHDYPTGYLVGKSVLEDQVSAAETKWESGAQLTQTEKHLLQLSQELAFEDFE